MASAALTALVAILTAGGTSANGGASTGVLASRQVLGSGLAVGGGDLTADRTIAVPKALPSDVATGTDDTKALTPFSVSARFGALAPLASPAFVGTPTAPTAILGANTTQIANMAALTAALAPFAPSASPVLTGSPTAPTQPAGDNSARLANTAYADRAVANFAANFAATLSPAGSYKLPGGLILQWTAVDLSTNADKAFTWATPCPNALLGYATAIETGDASATSAWTLKTDGMGKLGGNVRARVTTNGGGTGIQAGATIGHVMAVCS